MAEFKLPTETVELPSKGLFYPEDSPLASGTVEMKYMTAKEEDILTNTNYLAKGIAIDKLLESLLVDKSINYNELLIGDKNAIMLAARILSYGKDYEFLHRGEKVTFDLSTLGPKPFKEEEVKERKNEFKFVLPLSKNEITFKILNHQDERDIEKEVQGLQKINKDSNPEGSTRFKFMITSINGSREAGEIRKFVDGYLLAKDARALRQYYSEIAPDINFSGQVQTSNGVEEDVSVPIGITFFWPDADL
jgi:hypothetical protein